METIIDEEVDDDCTRTVTRTPIIRPTTGLLSQVDFRNTAPGVGGAGGKDVNASYVQLLKGLVLLVMVIAYAWFWVFVVICCISFFKNWLVIIIIISFLYGIYFLFSFFFFYK